MIRKTITIRSASRHLEPLRKKTERFLKRLKIPQKTRSLMLVAIGEACTNSIRHSYEGENNRLIRVAIEDFRDRTVFRIRDYGRKINLSKVKLPKLPPTQPHGLGIHIIRSFMDRVVYGTGHRLGNEVVLTKYKKQGDSHENAGQERARRRSAH